MSDKKIEENVEENVEEDIVNLKTINPFVRFVKSDPNNDPDPILAKDLPQESPNTLEQMKNANTLMDIEDRYKDQEIDSNGFFGALSPTQEEVENEREMEIREIVSLIKSFNTNTKVGFVRSTKRTGLSSQRRHVKDLVPPEELKPKHWSSRDNDYDFIRSLWDSNYGTDKNVGKNSLFQSIGNQTEVKHRNRKKVNLSENERKRCRFRKEWAKSMLKKDD